MITINVRYSSGAYQASGEGLRCSSTNCAKVAAEGLAKKYAARGNVEGALQLKEVTPQTFIAAWAP